MGGGRREDERIEKKRWKMRGRGEGRKEIVMMCYEDSSNPLCVLGWCFA